MQKDYTQDILQDWQNILDLIAELINVPAALIMKLDNGMLEVYISSHSEGNPYKTGEKEVMANSGLYCETVINTNSFLKVPNALTDKNWKNNPDIKLNMISYLGYPLHNPDGTPFGIICVLDTKENHYTKQYETLIEKFRDAIEDQLILVEKTLELEEIIEQLETRVLERTVELESAKEKAEQANRAKGIFIANMSHEFRTPLNAVLGFSQEMLEDQTISSKYRDYLSIIHRNGQLQLSLINNVLAMSNLEDGQTMLKLESFDLSKLLDDVIDKGLLAARAKNIAFNVEYTSEIPQFINSDYEKLQQIISTIIDNAIKYTETGGVILRLGSQPSDNEYDVELDCDVGDSGIGIPIEFQKHIFQPFSQVGEQNDKTGTGLGLTLAQRFLALMGGDISFESESGRGTTFHIRVPVKLATKAGFEPKMLLNDDVIGPSEAKDINLQLTARELKKLSDETLVELTDAVLMLDVEHVLEVTRRIEERTPKLASTLVTMVNNLDFKTLQRLLKNLKR